VPHRGIAHVAHESPSSPTYSCLACQARSIDAEKCRIAYGQKQRGRFARRSKHAAAAAAAETEADDALQGAIGGIALKDDDARSLSSEKMASEIASIASSAASMEKK